MALIQAVNITPSLKSTNISVIEIKLSGMYMKTRSLYFILISQETVNRKTTKESREIIPGDSRRFHFYYDLRWGQAIEKTNRSITWYQL
jgi:hypothetical protein